MSRLRYCNKCQDHTPTIDEDCTICGLSKPTPDHLKDKNHVDYMRRQMDADTSYEAYEDFIKEVPSIVNKWSYDFFKIRPAINAMGGWANFSHWVMKHAGKYFRYCMKHENVLAELVRLKRVKDNLPNIIEPLTREKASEQYRIKKDKAWKEAFKLVDEQYDYIDETQLLLEMKDKEIQELKHKLISEKTFYNDLQNHFEVYEKMAWHDYIGLLAKHDRYHKPIKVEK